MAIVIIIHVCIIPFLIAMIFATHSLTCLFSGFSSLPYQGTGTTDTDSDFDPWGLHGSASPSCCWRRERQWNEAEVGQWGSRCSWHTWPGETHAAWKSPWPKIHQDFCVGWGWRYAVSWLRGSGMFRACGQTYILDSIHDHLQGERCLQRAT